MNPSDRLRGMIYRMNSPVKQIDVSADFFQRLLKETEETALWPVAFDRHEPCTFKGIPIYPNPTLGDFTVKLYCEQVLFECDTTTGGWIR